MLIFDSLDDPQVVAALEAGKVGVLPTDTIYGLACLARDQAAVERLYRTKNREHKPGTVIAANIEQLESLGIKRRYLKVFENIWPNPISVVLPDMPELAYLDQGLRCLAVRVPADESIRLFLEQTGALLTTSANMPGETPASNIQEAVDIFSSKIDFYVDGGTLSGRSPSTVLKVIDDEVVVLREGAVSQKQIDDLLNG